MARQGRVFVLLACLESLGCERRSSVYPYRCCIRIASAALHFLCNGSAPISGPLLSDLPTALMFGQRECTAQRRLRHGAALRAVQPGHERSI